MQGPVESNAQFAAKSPGESINPAGRQLQSHAAEGADQAQTVIARQMRF